MIALAKLKMPDIKGRTAGILKKTGDEIGILAVMQVLRQNQYDAIDTPEARMIVESIKRSTNDLAPDASLEEVSEYVSNVSDTSMVGFINNIKGIYHEIKFVEAENADGDDTYARLHPDVNYPGSDVILTNADGEEVEVQLKAVNSSEPVKLALEKYPDTEVYATSEVADDLAGNSMVHDSGFSNIDITNEVRQELLDLDAAAARPLDFIPHAVLWSTTLLVVPVMREWWRGNITREQCAYRVAKITGLKVVKIVAIMALLSFPPTSAPTSVYLAVKVCYHVFKAYAR
ncbi:hypothetical protein Dtox_2983 [Desulfofarcimen acetoxidans DSM 771]|uniref:Uncharacterized protein n=1 Tax=Desulfofarcimen acetoxidans (strain ATCC 49208 / DSM 771 / KCTC 5769 / VKM B-1644 / 5575) TaxID=485916 RepID=C8W3F1_DESAS|nr:hypothetical protein [Desulfofarcimen acetoxidans]ACV63737.1 hypothetical protein Dtox_2983 [Desulfofarcimen acetoxidans DSM 771]